MVNDKPVILDLCAGKGGWTSKVNRDNFEVVEVDIKQFENTDIVMDVTNTEKLLNKVENIVGDLDRVLLVTASPPCIEFSKINQPWYDVKADQFNYQCNISNPDYRFDVCTYFENSLRIVESCFTIIGELNPEFYIVENVRGLNDISKEKAEVNIGPFYLWGDIPLLSYPDSSEFQNKWDKNCSEDKAEIPDVISEKLSEGIEFYMKHQ